MHLSPLFAALTTQPQSAIIALNAPEEGSVTQIRDFQALFLSVGFLVYGSLAIAISVFIVFYVGPRWGKKYMLVYVRARARSKQTASFTR